MGSQSSQVTEAIYQVTTTYTENHPALLINITDRHGVTIFFSNLRLLIAVFTCVTRHISIVFLNIAMDSYMRKSFAIFYDELRT